MAGIRALQKRLARLEDAGKPKPSLISVWYGSFDAWVEREVLPGVESGALAADDMVDLVACLRRWETDGTWGRHMQADGEPAWLLAWRDRDSQAQALRASVRV